MRLIFTILSIILLTSCSTRKEIVYFQDIEKIKDFERMEQVEPRIETNDVLRINVSSLNEEVAQPFNINNTGNLSGGGAGGTNNSIINGYLVDSEGEINFPVLGKIAVKGKTRRELEEYLTTEIKEYITDAVVQVRIVNFKVTVLGEVGNEGVIQVPDERISIPEVIAMSGGITYNGKRNNILVIRVEDGKRTSELVDITNADVFNNPYYFLKQNDIIYVEPTYRQVKSAGFITSYTGLISLITSAISLIILFSR